MNSLKKVIKEYWDRLSLKYNKQYHKNLLKDYTTSEHFIKRFHMFVNELYKKHPNNVDVICCLSSIENELRTEGKTIKLLESFISKYKNQLSNKDKARIYTNLGFYYEYDNNAHEYLLKAECLDSPFVETYKGLALHYFSKYQDNKIKEDLYKSLSYFEKAITISTNYEFWLGYAVCSFEASEYNKAKQIFEMLLTKYPNRMRLLLGIAYCEIYLGNKEKAISYLKYVKSGIDEQYDSNTDNIGDYEIFDAYYVLEEYDLYLEECEKFILEYYFADWDHYFYTLWIKKQHKKFNKNIDKYKNEIIQYIENIKTDYDLSEEEKQDDIKYYKRDLEKLEKMAHKIKNENYKPIIKLSLYPEYNCFLIDCIRHNF